MLIYDGILSKQTREMVLDAADRGYRFAIEVDHPPADDWQDVLTVRTWQERSNSASHPYDASCTRTGPLHIGVRRDTAYPHPTDAKGYYNGGQFIFLLDETDYRAALGVLKHVVNAKPFKTVIGDLND